MTHIEIWSDFACPFCYAGENILNRAIADLGVDDKVNVTYKAFELDHKKDNYASNPVEEVFMNKFGMSREDAVRQVRHEQQLVRDLGLPCNYEEARPSNTRDAHRLMKLAEKEYGKPVLRQLNAGLFNAYLVRRESLADVNVLEKIGREAGLKEEDIVDVLQSNRYADAVEADERRAEEYGVTGVPFFLINGKLAVPGAISVDDFRNLLQKIIEDGDSRQDEEALLQTTRPHRCTEDGCQLL